MLDCNDRYNIEIIYRPKLNKLIELRGKINKFIKEEYITHNDVYIFMTEALIRKAISRLEYNIHLIKKHKPIEPCYLNSINPEKYNEDECNRIMTHSSYISKCDEFNFEFLRIMIDTNKTELGQVFMHNKWHKYGIPTKLTFCPKLLKSLNIELKFD